MIAREQGKQLFLITQPHHAAVAGLFASHWKVTAFKGFDKLEDVLFAIAEHDRCWELADQAAFLNPETKLPYSFDDYPEDLKIDLYRKGLDELEKDCPYAAYLCSRHFASFFSTAGEGPGHDYYLSETVRQKRLAKKLNLKGSALQAADFHFQLLQFCDNLSLFICLNQAGRNSHPWFKKGIGGFEKPGIGPVPVKATWKGKEALHITPFPFDEEFTVQLEYRSLPAALSDQETLDRLWKSAPVRTQTIHFR